MTFEFFSQKKTWLSRHVTQASESLLTDGGEVCPPSQSEPPGVNDNTWMLILKWLWDAVPGAKMRLSKEVERRGEISSPGCSAQAWDWRGCRSLWQQSLSISSNQHSLLFYNLFYNCFPQNRGTFTLPWALPQMGLLGDAQGIFLHVRQKAALWTTEKLSAAYSVDNIYCLLWEWFAMNIEHLAKTH